MKTPRARKSVPEIPPKISVIVPVFNAAKTLPRLVGQILRQDFADFELILVDDGSTDDSRKVAKNLAAKNPKIRVLSEKNSGASAARNLGIAKAHGEFLMFFDSDDEISDKILATMLQKIVAEKSDLAVAGFTVKKVRGGREIARQNVGISPVPSRADYDDFRAHVLRLVGFDGRLYQVYNKIYRAKVIQKNALRFRENLNFGEDLTFNLDYLSHAKSLSFIYSPLYFYVQDVENGLFAQSSLDFSARLKNFRAIEKFAQKSRSPATRDYLSWIKFYWLFSLALSIKSAQISAHEKRKLLKNAWQKTDFPLAKNAQFIGKTRYIFEQTFAFFARKNLEYFFISGAIFAQNFAKKIMLRDKNPAQKRAKIEKK